jgi:hypothetical protein
LPSPSVATHVTLVVPTGKAALDAVPLMTVSGLAAKAPLQVMFGAAWPVLSSASRMGSVTLPPSASTAPTWSDAPGDSCRVGGEVSAGECLGEASAGLGRISSCGHTLLSSQINAKRGFSSGPLKRSQLSTPCPYCWPHDMRRAPCPTGAAVCHVAGAGAHGRGVPGGVPGRAGDGGARLGGGGAGGRAAMSA